MRSRSGRSVCPSPSAAAAVGVVAAQSLTLPATHTHTHTRTQEEEKARKGMKKTMGSKSKVGVEPLPSSSASPRPPSPPARPSSAAVSSSSFFAADKSTDGDASSSADTSSGPREGGSPHEHGESPGGGDGEEDGEAAGRPSNPPVDITITEEEEEGASALDESSATVDGADPEGKTQYGWGATSMGSRKSSQAESMASSMTNLHEGGEEDIEGFGPAGDAEASVQGAMAALSMDEPSAMVSGAGETAHCAASSDPRDDGSKNSDTSAKSGGEEGDKDEADSVALDLGVLPGTLVPPYEPR